MTDLLDKGPAIIQEAAKSPLGIAALIILAISFIAYIFFKKAGEKARIIIFLAMLVSLVGFGVAIIIIPPQPPPKPAPGPSPPEPHNPQPQTANEKQICPSLFIKFIPRFPYYLINTFKNNQRNPYIYWTILTGVNDCQEPKPVEVRFAVRNKTVAQATDIPWKRTFKVGEKVSREPVDPQFEFLQRAENTTLEVTWEIKDQNTNKTIASDTERIPVISDDYIDWNFKDHEGKDVPADFLLASLTAWSLTPGEVLRSQAKKYAPAPRGQTSPGDFLRQWFSLCYADLFQGPEVVKVNPYSEPWPPLGRGGTGLEKIRHPREILQAKEANSLEAALLVAALRNAGLKGIRSRLCLFVLPQADFYTGLKQFILSWSIDSQAWCAIDLTDPNKLNFNENQSACSTKVTNLMRSRGDILAALNEQGVVIDKSYHIFALDFDKASIKYGIGGLPQK
jgi:hypothetical protein